MDEKWTELDVNRGVFRPQTDKISIWGKKKSRQLYLPQALLQAWPVEQVVISVNESATKLRIAKALKGRSVCRWKNLKFRGGVINCEALNTVALEKAGHYRYELTDDMVIVYLQEEEGVI